MSDEEQHLSEPDFSAASIPAEADEPPQGTQESRNKAGGGGGTQAASDPQSDQDYPNDALDEGSGPVHR